MRRFVCYECALTPRHELLHGAAVGKPDLLDRKPVSYIHCPPSRLRKCDDCGRKRRAGWRVKR